MILKQKESLRKPRNTGLKHVFLKSSPLKRQQAGTVYQNNIDFHIAVIIRSVLRVISELWMGWLYIPLGSSFSQIVKGECTIYIKVIHSSLFRRSDFLWGRFILHKGTLIWVDMINIGTKLPDFMKLKGIRQSPLPQCVLEIVITVVDHLASTSSGYYMN